jgi:hypothetical protein
MEIDFTIDLVLLLPQPLLVYVFMSLAGRLGAVDTYMALALNVSE